MYANKVIRFRCSYKIIPLSLEKMGEIVMSKKTFFPYKFVTNKTLYYVGA